MPVAETATKKAGAKQMSSPGLILPDSCSYSTAKRTMCTLVELETRSR